MIGINNYMDTDKEAPDSIWEDKKKLSRGGGLLDKSFMCRPGG